MSRFGAAVVSFILPGFGQFLQGRFKLAGILMATAGTAWLTVRLDADLVPPAYFAAAVAPFLFGLHSLIALEAYRWPAAEGSPRVSAASLALILVAGVAISGAAFWLATPSSPAIRTARELKLAGNCAGLNAFVANRRAEIHKIVQRAPRPYVAEYRAESAELERIRRRCEP